MTHSSRRQRYAFFAIPGVIAGLIGMALSVFLASPDNGWERALYYSIAGLIGAPLATISWGAWIWRAQVFSGLSLLTGALGTTQQGWNWIDSGGQPGWRAILR
mgnify:CR=1 FL=1